MSRNDDDIGKPWTPALRDAWHAWHDAQDRYDRFARIEDRLTVAERREKADAGREADEAYQRYRRMLARVKP